MQQQDSFIVKDSKLVSILASVVFWLMFITSIFYNNFSAIKPGVGFNLFQLTIIPAILFLVKAFRNKIVFEINAKGIYYYGELITNWENFISANYTQEEKTLSFHDNFILLIEYYKPGTGKDFITKIGLPNTLNKAEEDIIEAIKKYCPGCNK